jgi:hypothetical protein
MSEFEIIAALAFVAAAVTGAVVYGFSSLVVPVSFTTTERAVLDLICADRTVGDREVLRRIAKFLYLEEVRGGGCAVDLGLIGEELFLPEARRILQARDGNSQGPETVKRGS